MLASWYRRYNIEQLQWKMCSLRLFIFASLIQKQYYKYYILWTFSWSRSNLSVVTVIFVISTLRCAFLTAAYTESMKHRDWPLWQWLVNRVTGWSVPRDKLDLILIHVTINPPFCSARITSIHGNITIAHTWYILQVGKYSRELTNKIYNIHLEFIYREKLHFILDEFLNYF